MAVPVIDIKKLLDGEEREMTMEQIHKACQEWGFFQLVNHGIPHSLLDGVQELFKEHYKNSMDAQFQDSAVVEMLESALSQGMNLSATKIDADWETGFFIQHSSHKTNTVTPPLPANFKETMEEFAEEVKGLAERVLEIMCENLGLEKGYLKEALAGGNGNGNSPFFGIKMCHYPPCPRPDLIDGLRSHTDAGGLILLLQDDEIDGLQVLKDDTWFDVQPIRHAIVIDIGDQLEVMTNGKYKSMWHRVLAKDDANRMSVAAFYNPSSEAEVYPPPQLMIMSAEHNGIDNVNAKSGYAYPKFVSKDYMKVYAEQKFLPKKPRFEAMSIVGHAVK
uniref:aminocyclopropanecarboxylate oxidase n=1 Tax=Picea sitchensis TaxID=3332 RepID=B8LQ40_PICSI|nr:unknown [Picea sitchensis]